MSDQSTPDPREQWEREGALAREAAFAYKSLLLSQPDETIALLSREAERGMVSRCESALRHLSPELGEELLARGSQSSALACEAIGRAAAFEERDDPGCLRRLSESFPQLWSIASNKALMADVAEAFLDRWPGDELELRAMAAAANAWIEPGLSPEAWEGLAGVGGPAWLAFLRAHGAKARDCFETRAPDERSHARQSWRGAWRLARGLGCSGYGSRGAWADRVGRADASFSDRLEAAAGLELLSEEARAAAANGDIPDHIQTRLSRVLTLALRACHGPSPDAGWSGFAERAASLLAELGVDYGSWRAHVPALYGLPAGVESANSGPARDAGVAPLRDALAMHPNPRWRSLGFDLGADLESATRAFRDTVVADQAARHKAISGISAALSPNKKTGNAAFEAFVEAHEIGLESDWAARARGDDIRRRSSRSGPRI